MSGPEDIAGASDTGKDIESGEELRGSLFVIRDGDKFLLQQRDEHCKYFPLQWCFPGEHKAPHESLEEAVIWGAKEEFELSLDASSLAPIADHKQPHAPGRVRVFVAPLPSGQTPVLKEGKDMKWYSLEEIKKLGTLGFGQSSFLPVLEQYLEAHP